jgi:hypothetical protein
VEQGQGHGHFQLIHGKEFPDAIPVSETLKWEMTSNSVQSWADFSSWASPYSWVFRAFIHGLNLTPYGSQTCLHQVLIYTLLTFDKDSQSSKSRPDSTADPRHESSVSTVPVLCNMV